MSYNKEKRKVNQKIWRDKRKEIRKEYDREYYQKNKEKILNNKLNYYKDNKELVNNYIKKRRSEDPLFRLKTNLRSLIRSSIISNGYSKKSRTYEILGCSYEEFKEQIESQWKDWMSWDNYGNPKDGIYELNKTWDLDHMICISSATSEEEIIRLNHHTNLQPLCSYTNRFIKRNS